MTKKEDLRVVKTKYILKKALIDLTNEKGFDNVSVIDIVKKANVNRNTFYLHYENKEDLIKKIIQEISINIENKLKATTYLKKTPLYSINEVHIRWYFRNLLMLIEPNISLLKTIMLDNSLNGYVNELFSLLKNQLSDLLMIKNSRSNLIFEYTFSGMVGLTTQWILYSPTTLNETTKILASLAYTSLRQFVELN